MLDRFEEEWKGGLKILDARDRTAHVAYITLMGALTLGQETAALQQRFEQVLLRGCQHVVFNLEDLIEIAPAGLGQLVLLKEVAQRRGIGAHVSQFPLHADLWVIIGLCSVYGADGSVG